MIWSARARIEGGHREAEHPGVLEIDDQLERRPLLNPVMSKITIKPGASVATAAAMLVFAFDCIHGIHHCDISGAGGGYGAGRVITCAWSGPDIPIGRASFTFF